MNKKFCAVFTIVNNESFFLPIWLKHYKHFFPKTDIYVLDHLSMDLSTSNLDVNVIKVGTNVLFDHDWLKLTVENFQKHLLNEYEIVIFSEVDELIYTLNESLHDSLQNFKKNNNVNFLTCNGYEVVQNLDQELAIELDSFFLKNRNFWYKTPLPKTVPVTYDKTLITKVPLQYTLGFHETTNNEINYQSNLFLLHLHRIDLNQKVKKQFYRNQNYQFDTNIYAGVQNRYKTFDEIYNWFRNTPQLEKIPLEHKETLRKIHM